MERNPPAHRFGTAAIAVAAGVLACVPFVLAQTSDGADGAAFFQREIEPLLREHCYDCHSHAAGKMKGGLNLDSRSGWAEGGDGGPAVIPGKPGESLLLKAVRHADPELKMPPKKPKLADADIAKLERWVALGAPD